MNSLSDNLTQVINSGAHDLQQKLQLPEEKKQTTYCCPWHKRGVSGHVGKFGLSSECLDCMEQIRNGYCAVDVLNFDLDTYWNVKRFWDKVDIRGWQECWPWTGGTRKGNTETAAYFPSPFHKALTHGASRVAFWTARGYTGKLRIFHQEGCDILCCNPLHLRIREMEEAPVPTEISKINFNYGSIFDGAKMEDKKDE